MELERADEEDAGGDGLATGKETADDGDDEASKVELQITISGCTDAEDDDEHGKNVLERVLFAEDEHRQDHRDAGDGSAHDLAEGHGDVLDADVAAEDVDAEEETEEEDLQVLLPVERLHLVALHVHRDERQRCREEHVDETECHGVWKVEAAEHRLVHQCCPAVYRQPDQTPCGSRERGSCKGRRDGLFQRRERRES